MIARHDVARLAHMVGRGTITVDDARAHLADLDRADTTDPATREAIAQQIAARVAAHRTGRHSTRTPSGPLALPVGDTFHDDYAAALDVAARYA